MNARLSRIHQAFLLPFLLVVGCNVSDSRDQVAPEPGTVLLVPRIVAATGELERTDSVQIRLELGDSLAKDTALPWGAGSIRLQGIKYGASWKLTARGFLNSSGTRRWIVWSGSDTGTMGEDTKSTTIDRTKFANVVASTLLTLPAVKLDGSDVPRSIVEGSRITLKAIGATSVAWSKNGSTPSCDPASVVDSAVVTFDSATTDSVTLKIVACKDSGASAVTSATFKVVARTAGFVAAPKAIDEVRDTMSVGDEFRLVPDTGASIAVTTDGTEPKCADAADDTATVAYDPSKSGTFVSVRAISCKGTTSSDPWTRSIFMRPSTVLAAPSLVGDQNPTLTVGTIFRIAGANVVHTTNKTPPACGTGTGRPDTALVTVSDASAGDSLVVRAVSCKNGDQSGEFRKAFFIPVPMPALSKKGGTNLGNPIAVGTDIVIKGIAGTKVAYTADGTAPVCDASAKDSLVHHVDSSKAEKTIVFKSIACKVQSSSAVKTDSIQVLALGVVQVKIDFPSGFDTSSTTVDPKVPLDTSITLTIPPGLTLRWKLAVDTLGKVDVADWSRLGVPGAADSVGVKLTVPTSQLARIPGGDSLATVIAVAVLLDSAKVAKDTVYLRWTVRLPLVPKPVVSVARTEGKVAFAWTPATRTGYAAWYKRDGGSDTLAAIARSGTSNTVDLNATSGQKLSLRVVATDSATGRSVQTIVDTVALRPPRKPGFTATNTVTTDGTIEVVLDAATLSDSAGVVWKVGAALGTDDVDFSSAGTIRNGRWSGKLNAGSWKIGVQATRDSIVKVSDTTIVVTNTGGLFPNKPDSLRWVASDTGWIRWNWKSLTDHTYLVYKSKSGKALASAADLVGLTPDTIGTGTFTYSTLKSGDSASIAVIAVMKKDSTGGPSQSAFSGIAYTMRAPAEPTFKAAVVDTARGRYRVEITNYDPTCVYYLQTIEGGAWDTLHKQTDTLTAPSAGWLTVSVKAVRSGLATVSKASVTVMEVKKTNDNQPKAPEGLGVQRYPNRIVLKWHAEPWHAYQVFWDSSSSEAVLGIADTGSATKVNAVADSFELPYPVGRVSPFRFAVRTTNAPDSTKGPSDLSAVNAPKPAPPDSVDWFSVTIAGTGLDFTWNAVEGAVKYKIRIEGDSEYVANESGGGTNYHTLKISSKIAALKNLSITLKAVSAEGLESPPSAPYFLHIPQRRVFSGATIRGWISNGSGNASAVWNTGLDSAPTQARFQLRERNGSDSTAWRVFDPLKVNSASLYLSSQAMDKNREYVLLYQFEWRGSDGSTYGDTTRTDTLRDGTGNVRVLNLMKAPPIPQGYAEVKDGKRYLTLTSLKTDSVQKVAGSRMAWRGYAYNYDKIDLVNGINAGIYDLRLGKVETFFVNGTDTSSMSMNDMLTKDSLKKDDNASFYKTAYVAGRSWMLEPLSISIRTPPLSWLDAMGMDAVPVSVGDIDTALRKGLCPDGWLIPTRTEFRNFFKAMNPGAVDLDNDATFQEAFTALRIDGANPDNIYTATIAQSGRPSMYHINSTTYSILWVPDQTSGYTQTTRIYCVKKP